MTPPAPTRPTLAERLRSETVGGALLVLAALAAVVAANSGLSDSYARLQHTTIGPASLGLHMDLAHWAADGLLAVFFFIVGLELKEEFVAGELRSPRKAMVPVAAAVGGAVVPAAIYLAVAGGAAGAGRGWAIPTATDIAFAVAVLAIVGPRLPRALRTFLLTLAVVDDLIAITIIALFYTDSLELAPLLLAVAAAGLWGFLVHWRTRFFAEQRWALWAILLPIGCVVWAGVFNSGLHATIAGVVLGLLAPALPRQGMTGDGLAHRLVHRIQPLSVGFAVPVFAFLAAGVDVRGAGGVGAIAADPVVLGILAGLVLGKPLGIVAATWAVTRLTPARLDGDVSWWDLPGLGLLAGIGFTVALLIGELAFDDPSMVEHAKVGVLAASVVAALAAAVWLGVRNSRVGGAGRQ